MGRREEEDINRDDEEGKKGQRKERRNWMKKN